MNQDRPTKSDLRAFHIVHSHVWVHTQRLLGNQESEAILK